MRTLKLTIAYDGTDYSGWQLQRNAPRTIQAVLQQTLKVVTGERLIVIGSGRTDAGVHALGQVAHVRVRSSMACDRLRLALNHRLPSDIVVRAIEDVASSFQAQYHATSKRYAYRIINGPVVLPFERRYVRQVWPRLNVALMRREAMALRGRHDFCAFQAAGRHIEDTRRTVSNIRVSQRGTAITIEVEANGFLYHMVRNIVGTLVDIGRGYRPPGTMRKLLRAKDRRLAGPTAPARGLCLVSVAYGNR